jgi:hypothetical protein
MDTALRKQFKDLIWNAESSIKVETLEYVQVDMEGRVHQAL